jgi:hypothetical protein
MELAPLAKQRFFDSNGVPLSGGKLYTYDAGTTTPKTTYSDRTGTANTNPVILDSNGYADVWIDSGYYKFILKDSSDNTIWTKDQISLPSEAALASAFWRDVVYLTSADSPVTLTQSHNGKLLSVDASGGAVSITLPQISLTVLPFNIGFKLTNATNSLTINRTGTDTIEGSTSKVVSTTNASCQLIADIDKSPDQWAVIDFGVVDFSGYPTVTPDSTDFVPIVDTSAGSINKKASFKNFKNAVYRSVTTTDSVGADDDTMKLSGASFTSTLPTAVGVDGKRYKFVHAGTSLTQVYTFNTTSSQTIGGVASGSYKLYTNGEVLVVESDGANWIVISHYTDTGWTSSGAISIGAVTSAPTKPNTGITTDRCMWMRRGKNVRLRYEYLSTVTTGSAAGTGMYTFGTPTGITIDTNFISTSTDATASTLVTGVAVATNGNIGWAADTTNSRRGFIIPRVYNSTNFSLAIWDSTAFSVVSASVYPLNSVLGFSFEVEVPVSGWLG